MSTKTADDTKGTGRPRVLPGVFGIDADGRRHRYDRLNGRLFVTDGDGAVEHEQRIEEGDPGNDIDAWIAYVDEECGWLDEWGDVDNLFEAVLRHRDALETARERGLVEEAD